MSTECHSSQLYTSTNYRILTCSVSSVPGPVMMRLIPFYQWKLNATHDSDADAEVINNNFNVMCDIEYV